MRKKKEDLKSLIERLVDRSEQLHNDSHARREFVIKSIRLFEKDLTQDEKVRVVTAIYDELTYRKIVEKPEFLVQHTNAKIKPILFTGGMVIIVIIVAAVFFSTNPIIHSLNEWISKLFYYMG